MKRRCRMCKHLKFRKVIDFGKNPLVNSLLEKDELGTEKTYPLVVQQCKKCFLVQTKDPIDSHEIYTNQDYLYYSSDMPGLEDYFNEYVEDLVKRFGAQGLAVEIGSNDGLLLNTLQSLGMRVLGVDPSTNVVLRALGKGISTLAAPFNARWAKHISNEFGKAKYIIANNCIAHIDDLDDVMLGVFRLLHSDDGVFVIECNYWGAMVKNKNYSLIYHDHLSYFTIKNWVDYLNGWGLEIFDAIVTPAQGGSLRLFISRIGNYKPTSRFNQYLKGEILSNFHSYETAKKYRKEVLEEADKLHRLISELKKEGATIAGYGAAAKGFSVLKLAQIDGTHLDYFVDDSPAKQGKYTPVTHIPVVNRYKFSDPDYFFITAPNYKDVIIKKEADFIKKGGKFITVESEII